MRELNETEIAAVAGGGTRHCTRDDTGNNYGGVTDTESFGDDLINFYEGLVSATSHIIERVAEAL